MNDYLSACLFAARVLLGSAALIVVTSLLRRKTLADRMIAMDFLSTVVVALIILAGYETSVHSVIVPGIAMALVSFIAIVALARLFQKGREKGVDDD